MSSGHRAKRRAAKTEKNRKKARRRAPRGSWRWLYLRDRGKCHICGKDVDPTADVLSPLYPTADHIVPRSLGGLDHMANMKLAHRGCNAARGNTPISAHIGPVEV